MSFTDLGLSPALLRALAAQSYDSATPIQARAIPVVLAGKDLLASAQTGTGKTAAFALPLLERLYPQGQRPAGAPKFRALVLTPTRELAAQVHDSLRTYGKFLGLSSAAIFGGVGMGGQFQLLRRGVDILVATPGRLIDHLERGSVRLDNVQMLVLDEADRMLDMGFLPALKKILAALPSARQSLMFSATFADEIKALAAQFLRTPTEVQVAARNSVASTVTHRVHPVDAARKRELLHHLLAQDSRRQTLVFSRTKHGADKLCRFLEGFGFAVAAIHGNKTQGARTRALGDFKRGKVSVLVATDIAARGLDIDQLPVVVNFDLPMVAEDYVHRIGRTGRAGLEGQAISLVAHEERHLLRDIGRLIQREIAIEPIAGFEPAQPLRLDAPGTSGPRGKHRPGQRQHHQPGKRPHQHSQRPGQNKGAKRDGKHGRPQQQGKHSFGQSRDRRG
jgi:ATP-dependent RNA helicase RhlE